MNAGRDPITTPSRSGFAFAALRLLLLMAVATGCGLPGTSPSTTRSPNPEVTRSIEVRQAAGLRSDREWVEKVIADPDAVSWNGIRVSPREAAQMDDIRVREAMEIRAAAGLPADEATVRAILADPTTVEVENRMPVTPAEAEAWNARVSNLEAVAPTITAYGRKHREDWADLNVEPDGTVIAFFSDNIEKHRTAIAALFVPGTVRYEIRQVRWSLRELNVVRTKVRKADAWFEKHGIRYNGGGVHPAENLMVVNVETMEARPGLEQMIIEHFEAEGKMRVAATVHQPLNLGRGTLTVTVIDLAGQPVAGVGCVLDPDLERAAGESTHIETDERGICRWDPIGAAGFKVEIWKGYETGFLGAGRVQVGRGQHTTLTIKVSLD